MIGLKTFIYGFLCVIVLCILVVFVMHNFLGIEFSDNVNGFFEDINSGVFEIKQGFLSNTPVEDNEFRSMNVYNEMSYKGTSSSPMSLSSNISEILSEMIKAIESGETHFYLKDTSSSFNTIKERVKEIYPYFYSVESMLYPILTGVTQSRYDIDDGFIMLTLLSTNGETGARKDYEKLCSYVRDDLTQMFNEGLLRNSMSDKEKSLVVAQHIVENTNYDRTVAFGKSPPGGARSHNPLGFYEGWEIVCDGYSGLYNVFMWELGIESYMISSANHAWNIVKLDGGWYHTDVTYSDPLIRDSYGQIIENNDCREEYINTSYSSLQSADSSGRVLRAECKDVLKVYLGLEY